MDHDAAKKARKEAKRAKKRAEKRNEYERAAAQGVRLSAPPRKPRLAPPALKRVPPFTGNLYVLESATDWTLLDTLDPNLIPERVKLVSAVREGFEIPLVNVSAKDLDSLKNSLPAGQGTGRYYLLVQTAAKLFAWLEVTPVVTQQQ
jgi:hypothetical protein